MKTKIQIKSIFGKVLFEYKKENNTIKDTLCSEYLNDADLRGADLRDIILHHADLRGAYLRDADLRDTILHHADLRGAYLHCADLRGADLRGADLRGAYLHCADLRGADLRGADLRGVDLHRADLNGAILHHADLRDANLDFSCLSFSCNSRKPKTDRKQRVQLAHHLLSWFKYSDNLSEDEKLIFEQLKQYANEFHREDVEKF